MRCSKCGKELLHNEKICPVCNTKQIKMKKRINAFISLAIVLIAIGLIYFLSPVDLLPGLFLDDAAVGAGSILLAIPSLIVGLIKNTKN